MSLIRMVDSSGNVVPEVEPTPIGEPVSSGFQPGEIDKMAISQVLGVENEMSKYQDDLETIVSWAKREGYENPTELKWMIRALQAKLGTPPLSEKWIKRVSRYAWISNETKKLEQEQRDLML